METDIEPNSIDRELTTTERAIAVAQINDRLTRLACALQEAWDKFQSWVDDLDNDTPVLDAACETVKVKYGIPQHMNLRSLIIDESPLLKHHVSQIKKFVPAFVCGTLIPEEMGIWIFHFEEFAQFDFGWVLLGKSLRYYEDDLDGNREQNHDAILKEVCEIGSRSKKRKMLPETKHTYAARFLGRSVEK